MQTRLTDLNPRKKILALLVGVKVLLALRKLARLVQTQMGHLLRGFLARSFGAAPGTLLTTLLPVPIPPTGAARSIAAWI